MKPLRSRTIRLVFVTVNCVALLGALAAWICIAVSMGGPLRVTELDRNRVFDEAALRSYSPQLAENLRTNVGRWIQEPARAKGLFVTYCFGGLAALNIIGYYVLERTERTPNEIA